MAKLKEASKLSVELRGGSELLANLEVVSGLLAGFRGALTC